MTKLWSELLNKLKRFEYNNLYPLFFTIVFILILIQYSFSSLDAIFYDLWIKADLGIRKNDNIIIVTLDEESDEFLGETYPYTYATHSRFMEKIIEDDPKIINYFVQLLEPDSPVEEKFFELFKDKLSSFQLKAKFRFGTDMDAWGEQLPPSGLRNLGYSLAVLNVDNQAFAKDDVHRRAILNISGEDSLHLWTANQFRIAEGQRRLDANSFLGAYYNREADATFSLIRYYTSPAGERNEIPSIPFHRVVTGIPKGFFKDKIVLVGPKYISNSADFVYTPFGRDEMRASKMDVHAVIIQALMQNKTVFQIPDLLTDMLSILIALFLSFIISRVRPTRGLLITISIMVGTFALSYILFSAFGMWMKLSHVILSIFVVYYIWVPFRAIGEYQTRYAIQEEAKLLKRVDNLKQNFISLMSHDLKTPVAKIAGIADILATQYDNTPQQKTLLDNIIHATRELNKFITSILDLTKIESQNLNMNLVAKDLNKLVEGVVEKLKFEASSADVQVKVDLGPLYPIKVDVELINRVISNLVENAIKYSGKNSSIEIKTWDDESWVYLEIQDNGVGISEEDLEHVFDKFYRVKNDSTHSIKGSGLGLYLVKYFIELHGGEIGVQSKIGEGTTFLIKLRNQ